MRSMPKRGVVHPMVNTPTNIQQSNPQRAMMKRPKQMRPPTQFDDFDDMDDSIGFKVGGAYDVTQFRDKLQQKKMPRTEDISVEGIYNEYYFETEKNQKGTEIKEDDDGDDEKDHEEGDDNDDDDDSDEDEKDDGDGTASGPASGSDLFYPSYCYAKSKVPYAILAAKSVTNGIPENGSEEEKEDNVYPMPPPFKMKKSSDSSTLTLCFCA